MQNEENKQEKEIRAIRKARFWWAVLYPENMRPDWEEQVGDILQLPYAYCKHTSDRDTKSEHRKDHVHLIIAFPNTTTYNHAFKVFNLLSSPGKRALNKCEAIIHIRHSYDYLIHDTETARKQGKELYSPDERTTGNNFDIGAYEQIGITERNDIFVELGEIIREQGFINYIDFYSYLVDNYDEIAYLDVMRSYSNHFNCLIKGNYLKWKEGTGKLSKASDCGAQHHDSTTIAPHQHHDSTTIAPHQHHEHHENTTPAPQLCCPWCGSISLKKRGKTLSKRQRWACKDCEKTFVES